MTVEGCTGGPEPPSPRIWQPVCAKAAKRPSQRRRARNDDFMTDLAESATTATKADAPDQGLEDARLADRHVGDGALDLGFGRRRLEALDLLLFQQETDMLLDLQEELAVL